MYAYIINIKLTSVSVVRFIFINILYMCIIYYCIFYYIYLYSKKYSKYTYSVNNIQFYYISIFETYI